MIQPIYASFISQLMALITTFYAVATLLDGEYANSIGIMGIASIFVWYAINSEKLVVNLTFKELFSPTVLESSKCDYLLIIGILCLSLSFAFSLLELS